jgi:hypothetical protein
MGSPKGWVCGKPARSSFLCVLCVLCVLSRLNLRNPAVADEARRNSAASKHFSFRTQVKTEQADDNNEQEKE